jgi:hypothetical protein
VQELKELLLLPLFGKAEESDTQSNESDSGSDDDDSAAAADKRKKKAEAAKQKAEAAQQKAQAAIKPTSIPYRAVYAVAGERLLPIFSALLLRHLTDGAQNACPNLRRSASQRSC